MGKFIVRRLAQSVLVFFLFLTLTFFLIELQPGDFADRYIENPDFDIATRMELEERLGVNQPVFQRYTTYLANFFRGEFGISFIHGEPVVDVIAERLPRTVMLFLSATVISFYLGFAVGKFIAWRRNGFVETATTIGGVYLFTVFLPWFALLMLWLFSAQLDWFPLSGFISPSVWFRSEFDENTIFSFLLLTLLSISALLLIAFLVLRKWHVQRSGLIMLGLTVTLFGLSSLLWFLGGAGTFVWDMVRHLGLPIMVLTAVSFAGTMLLTRNSMLETIREDYVMVARAKGVSEKTLRDKYVSRNAILPVITSLVLSLAFAIDGGVITEGVFSWEGLGLALLDSALQSDIPLAVGAFLFVGLFALVAHVVVDILYVFLDPRLKFE